MITPTKKLYESNGTPYNILTIDCVEPTWSISFIGTLHFCHHVHHFVFGLMTLIYIYLVTQRSFLLKLFVFEWVDHGFSK